MLRSRLRVTLQTQNPMQHTRLDDPEGVETRKPPKVVPQGFNALLPCPLQSLLKQTRARIRVALALDDAPDPKPPQPWASP